MEAFLEHSRFFRFLFPTVEENKGRAHLLHEVKKIPDDVVPADWCLAFRGYAMFCGSRFVAPSLSLVMESPLPRSLSLIDGIPGQEHAVVTEYLADVYREGNAPEIRTERGATAAGEQL